MFNTTMPGCCRAIAAAAAVSMSYAAVRADSVSLVPVKDNTLFSTGDTSNGAGPQVFSGRTGMFQGFIRQRAVLEFDIAAAVPAGATITSATLTLHLERAGNEMEEMHTLHRVVAEWGEGTSAAGGGTGGPATDMDATWLHTYFPDQTWASAGGDFEAASSAEQIVPVMDVDAIPVTWGSTPLMIADAQAWLDSPDDNHGWLLMGNEEGVNTARKFSSREHPEPSQRPVLVIEFEMSPPDACPGDVNDDGVVDVTDLLLVVHAFGEGGDAPADVNADGVVSLADLLLVIGNFGPCPAPAGDCAGDLTGDGQVDVSDLLQVAHAFGATGDRPEDLTGDGRVDVRDLLHIMQLFGPCP